MAELDGTQIERLRRALDARSSELLAEIADELRASGDERHAELAGQVLDSGDESVADLLADTNAAMLGRHMAEVREIEAARRRISDGSYGACVECADDIPLERLEVYPSAARCVPCQSKHERLYARETHSSL
jgi:RNA polymerase-binding transcription factor DksA